MQFLGHLCKRWDFHFVLKNTNVRKVGHVQKKKDHIQFSLFTHIFGWQHAYISPYEILNVFLFTNMWHTDLLCHNCNSKSPPFLVWRSFFLFIFLSFSGSLPVPLPSSVSTNSFLFIPHGSSVHPTQPICENSWENRRQQKGVFTTRIDSRELAREFSHTVCQCCRNQWLYSDHPAAMDIYVRTHLKEDEPIRLHPG